MTHLARRVLPLAGLLLSLSVAGCAPDAMTQPQLSRSAQESAPATAPAPSPSEEPGEPEATPAPETPRSTASTADASPSASERDSEAATPSPTPSEALEPAPSPALPLPPALLSPGDDKEEVRELQHRLLQLDWYRGKIVTHYGDGTQVAVRGFQAKRGLPVLGFVDKTTWDTLVSMTRKPTNDEMHNVVNPGPAMYKAGSSGDKVKDLQARLKQLEWYTDLVDGKYGDRTVAAVKGFQTKRAIPVTGEVDQRTLDRLWGMTRTPTKDELNNVHPKPPTAASGFKLDDRCLTGRVICVSKAQRRLAWVVDGTVVDTMSVRFGSELTPTREGTFAVEWKSRNHVSKLYKTPMPYALFFSGGQAIHYSRDFAARGYNGASHGCVNVRDKSAVGALFDAAREGDKVIVF